MQDAGACGFLLNQSCAKGFVPCRKLRKAVEQGPEVKTSPADHDRKRPACRNFGNHAAGVACIVSGRVNQTRIPYVDHVVPDFAALGGRNFGSSNIETIENLERIAVHHFAAEGFGEVQSQRAFAGSGGSGDYYQWFRQADILKLACDRVKEDACTE